MSLYLSLGGGEVLAWRDGRGDPPPLHNPPGLSALAYRIGRYDSWLDLMIHALMEWDYYPLTTSPTQVASDATFMSPRALPPAQRRRIRLNLSEEDNWILGLLRAWSTVGDVLAFYQERLLNEGYLRTARRPTSVHELARLLDYRPRPVVGGSVELAFHATDVEGLPPRVRIAAGTAVTSVPPPGGAPQNFETVAQLEARSEWNLLRPARVDVQAPPVLRGSSTRLSLRGTGLALDPGAGVLIRGRRDGEEAAFFRVLGGVEAVAAEPAQTSISWQAPLDPERPEAELGDLEVHALRQHSRLFGYRAPRWEEEPLAVRRRHRTLLGGVQMLAPPAGWRSLNEGLPETAIRCLAQDPTGNLFAGTAGDGVWCRPAGSDGWRRGEGGQAQLDVRSLAVEPTGGVVAGTATGGVYRSTDRGAIWTELTGRTLGRARWTLMQRSRRLDRLPETPVRALVAVGEGEGWSLVAGTDSGVYLSTDLANSWLPRNGGFPGVDATTGETSLVVAALARGGDARELFAGTAAGVFRSGDLGRRWRAMSRGLPGTDPVTGLGGEEIRALVFHRDRRRREDLLFAGTSRGVYRSRDGGAGWKPAREGMLGPGGGGFPAITSLVVVEDPITVTTRLFAGSEAGLWESRDLGESWSRVELGAPGPPGVTALAAGPRARLVVASPFAGFAEEEWPGFHLSGGRIDLDRLATAPATGGWVVLAPDPDLEDPPPVGVYRVKGTATVERRDFKLEATVTRIEVAADPELRRYPLRRTQVYFQSQELPLLPRPRPADPAAAMVGVRAALAAMESDRPVIVTADPRPPIPAARASAAGDGGDGDVGGGGAGDEAVDDEAAGGYGGALTAGELGSALVAALGSRTLALPAASPAAVADPFAGSRRSPVAALSLRVRGNVAAASEGRTVREEVLGDGDGSRSFQRFPLAEPLAYLRGAAAPRSTLSVRVNEQLWREVPRLHGEAPDARVYEVERDPDGRATVVFGDGVHGARLPSGRGNVVATYRTGTSDREILPGSVRLMTSRPLGLSEVGNPLAGTPGAPAEELDSIRWRAPRSVRTLGRIVSLRDYQDFAESFPGIVKATARELALVGRRIVHLTVATRGPDHLPAAGSRLLDELLAAIEEIRCDPQPVHVVPFRRVGLEVAGKVRIAPGFFWDEVVPRLRVALAERFSFERSRFGDALSVSEAIRVLQGVEGVEAVDLDVFRRAGTEEGVVRRVVAGPAFWDGESEAPSAAELVWLESAELRPMKEEEGSPPEG